MQGWIDTTYMNEDATFRLARGNKGTLFVREYTGQPARGSSLLSVLKDWDLLKFSTPL